MGGAKKKWSKGKGGREAASLEVLFTEKSLARAKTDIPKMKLITVSTVVERLKCNGSLARQAINILEKEGAIICVAKTHKQYVYTRNVTVEEEA
jgi:small subunit ribosomal protein S25e